MELHGGRVNGASDGPDGGATFRIALPLAPATRLADELTGADAFPALRG